MTVINRIYKKIHQLSYKSLIIKGLEAIPGLILVGAGTIFVIFLFLSALYNINK